jgi:hypothetical protein
MNIAAKRAFETTFSNLFLPSFPSILLYSRISFLLPTLLYFLVFKERKKKKQALKIWALEEILCAKEWKCSHTYTQV